MPFAVNNNVKRCIHKTKQKWNKIRLQLLQRKHRFLLVPRQALNFGRLQQLTHPREKRKKIELNSREVMQRTNKSFRITTEESIKETSEKLTSLPYACYQTHPFFFRSLLFLFFLFDDFNVLSIIKANDVYK